MFERRLKLFLGLLFVMTLVLVVRAGQLQIIRRSHWASAAMDAMKRQSLVETTRGTLRDVRGVVIAQDVACIDACVDYRAITDPPDEKWLATTARQWARKRRSDEWRGADAAKRRRLVEEERAHVLERLRAMWATLARLGERTPDQIDEIRHDIRLRIESQHRHVWNKKYSAALKAYEDARAEESPGWWSKWLSDENADQPDVDDYKMMLAEQADPHPIIKAISSEVQNYLGKNIDDFPGLALRPGLTRVYPGDEVACHVIGNLTAVDENDLKKDPFRTDELRKYQYADLIGRKGLEALCEPLLRGTRGRIERTIDPETGAQHVTTIPAIPGQDVTATIDMSLQDEVLKLFEEANVEFHPDPSDPSVVIRRKVSVHGGAVLIDLRSGAVRAIVSNPTYDLNKLDLYEDLAKDGLERALMNRATQFAVETGSTVKPVVGLGAITQGIIGVNEGIECIGFLVHNGKPVTSWGKCWVATRWLGKIASVAHHPIPVPHHGHDGNADGFLTFSDALERSCNVYFETLGKRLGLAGLSYWMDQFGMGRPTGIGIEEASGQLPNSYHGTNLEYTVHTAGIGQGPVRATPLQMANVAATIARNGVWLRPTLLPMDRTESLRAFLRSAAPATQPSTKPARTPWWQIADRADLHLSPQGLIAAREGMYRVVNSEAGTGKVLRSDLIPIAGKTGTAELGMLFDTQPDENGNMVRAPMKPSTSQYENPRAKWYLSFDEGKHLNHSWIIGYAPANDPQVAFAVMVEYGGSGGGTAGNIAKGMLAAAIKHGYLATGRTTTTGVDTSGR